MGIASSYNPKLRIDEFGFLRVKSRELSRNRLANGVSSSSLSFFISDEFFCNYKITAFL